MTADRKADHVGNHGGAYTDLDGNRKQFTYIDHDKKPKISLNLPTTGKYSEEDYRKYLQDRILAVSASYCPVEFSDFIKRGADQVALGWNEAMLQDKGISTNMLRDLVTILENR